MASLVKMFLILILAFLSLTASHPGHDHKREAGIRSNYLKSKPRSLAHCAATLRSRGHEEAALMRRQSLAEDLQRKRSLGPFPHVEGRDLADPSTSAYNLSEPLPREVFTDNTSCILQPESIEGPYYVDGEFIRSNITNGEAGVAMIFDVQIIDTSTCAPIRDTYLDLWHCNSTGVYSGVVADGNGDRDDTDNLQNTAFRGVQKTNSDGVVQFETVFPGHYIGRTNHIHVLTHHGPDTQLHRNNNTISGLTASHVGQLYFDQSLIDAVEAVEPYKQNRQAVTRNDEDQILAAENRFTDPIVKHVLLGNAGSLDRGVLAWVSIGIDPDEKRVVSAGETLKMGPRAA